MKAIRDDDDDHFLIPGLMEILSNEQPHFQSGRIGRKENVARFHWEIVSHPPPPTPINSEQWPEEVGNQREKRKNHETSDLSLALSPRSIHFPQVHNNNNNDNNHNDYVCGQTDIRLLRFIVFPSPVALSM